MRQVIKNYGLWVLLPVVVAFLLGHTQIRRTVTDRTLASEARFARLADLLFREEMASQGAAMVEDATILPNPDPADPVARAALAGDTVVALGTLSGELVLSVALGEEAGPGENREGEATPFRVRAATETFPALFLNRIRSKTGHTAALYFRGSLVAGERPGFGPETLGNEETSPRDGYPVALTTSMGTAALLPIGQVPGIPSTLHILVASSAPALPFPSPWKAAWPAIVGAVLGVGALLWANRRKRTEGSSPSPTSTLHLFAFGAGICGLWAALLGPGRRLEGEVAQAQEREMVQTLALVAEGGDTLGLEAVAQATGYGIHQVREGSLVFSTEIDPDPWKWEGLPVPDPSFPSTGVMGNGREAFRFVALSRPSGDVLSLTRRAREDSLRNLLLKLSVLGGAASLLGLVFLSSSHSHRARGGTRPTETGAPGP